MKKSQTTSRRLARQGVAPEGAHPKDAQNATIGRPRKKDGLPAQQAAKRRTKIQIEADFWKRVKITAVDECWEWQGGKNGREQAHSYGVVWINNVRLKTHRLAFTLANGPIPPGMCVCHKCDNPACCNPKHLFIGTFGDNARDMIAKGRAHRESGTNRYNAKLSDAQVNRIKREAPFRKRGWGIRIAAEFGVCPSAINNIVMGRRWRLVAIHENPNEARKRGLLK